MPAAQSVVVAQRYRCARPDWLRSNRRMSSRAATESRGSYGREKGIEKERGMSDRSRILLGDVGLSGHILPVSATLIGVCVTLVGLVKVVEIRIGNSRVDEYAALAAIAFLTCSIASYLPIRGSANDNLSYWLEQAADASSSPA
jgi:hypothetical protein